jgi:hypothetical protein
MATGSHRLPSRNLIGKRVREARRLHSPALTQDQLSGKLAAKGVQLDRVAIAKIETGIRSVFDFEVKGFAAALKVEVNWLLGIASTGETGKQRNGGGRKSKG